MSNAELRWARLTASTNNAGIQRNNVAVKKSG